MTKSHQGSGRRRHPKTRGLVDELRPLVTELVAIQKQARSLGLFVEDRELLTCPHCGLQENVAADGRLMTYRSESVIADTGLRFKKRLPEYSVVRRASVRCLKPPSRKSKRSWAMGSESARLEKKIRNNLKEIGFGI